MPIVATLRATRWTNTNDQPQTADGRKLIRLSAAHWSHASAGYPLTTAPSGQWTTTNVGQWTAAFLPGFYWQMAALARRQAPGKAISN